MLSTVKWYRDVGAEIFPFWKDLDPRTRDIFYTRDTNMLLTPAKRIYKFSGNAAKLMVVQPLTG
jgi:hypothetical protein